ncbi:MAG: hypothetical protein ACD_75C01959G0002 [uncultured bacterium]|nr:MAG: hypothetical protein ACD_75C01959G0002 [uncultured bacterium]
MLPFLPVRPRQYQRQSCGYRRRQKGKALLPARQAVVEDRGKPAVLALRPARGSLRRRRFRPDSPELPGDARPGRDHPHCRNPGPQQSAQTEACRTARCVLLARGAAAGRDPGPSAALSAQRPGLAEPSEPARNRRSSRRRYGPRQNPSGTRPVAECHTTW